MFNHILTSCRQKYTQNQKTFLRRSDSKDEKFPVKIGEIRKIEKKKLCITFRVFGYEYKENFPSCILKTTFERYVDLLFIEKEDQTHYVLVKDLCVTND